MNNASARLVRIVLGAIAALTFVLPASAEVRSFPKGFRTEQIKTDGATIYVRVGGKGPAVVMLHGFGDTGDMWAPLAAPLVKDHTVIVPDLRGMGLSSYPDACPCRKLNPDISVVQSAQDLYRQNAADGQDGARDW